MSILFENVFFFFFFFFFLDRFARSVLLKLKVCCLAHRGSTVGFLLLQCSSDVAWPTGVQLLVFFCSSVPVVLFDTPGVAGCQSQHVPVESSSLLHHSIYL